LLARALRGSEPAVLHVAAAADLEPVLPAILAAYEKQSGIHAEVSFASSATLTQQIENGAPFDLFLAADTSFPERVIAAGRGLEPGPVPYARGRLVLWSRRESGLAPLSVDTLRDPRLHRLAVANPAHAPYGRAAAQAIAALGLTAALGPRLVTAENIAQAAQFAESGGADAGLLSLTSARSARLSREGEFIVLPAELYQPLRQAAVVLRGPRAESARALLAYLQSPPARALLAAGGLDPLP
jgi:molybdate transport system substrate-binding protein